MSIGNAPPPKNHSDEYGTHIGPARWMTILRATENNPTLKELANELHVMYQLSEEVKQDDDSISGIFSPTEKGEWRGVILG
jgi:hypothetical protein